MSRLAIVSLLATALGVADLGAQTEAFQGTWQVSEIIVTGPSARIISPAQPGLLIFTPMHYSMTEVRSEQPRPEPADFSTASADEVRAAWEPFRAQAGTYQVSDSTITTRPFVAKNPSTMAPGVILAYRYRIQGDTLRLTQVRIPGGPVQGRVTIEYRRIE